MGSWIPSENSFIVLLTTWQLESSVEAFIRTSNVTFERLKRLIMDFNLKREQPTTFAGSTVVITRVMVVVTMTASIN